VEYQSTSALLVTLLLGVCLGLAIGAWRWRRAVLQLNGALAGKDRELASARAQADATGPAQPFEYGLKLYRINRFDQAFPVLLAHAEQGHPHATSLVAKMYFAGNGVPRDKDRYRYWLQRAAEAGDKAAKAIVKRFD
jgi:TPR repeat protein